MWSGLVENIVPQGHYTILCVIFKFENNPQETKLGFIEAEIYHQGEWNRSTDAAYPTIWLCMLCRLYYICIRNIQNR